MTTDTTTFGTLSELNKDFKSSAMHEVDFRDLMFLHYPSGVWAGYDDVGSGANDFGSFVDALGGTRCYGGGSPEGYSKSNGSLTTRGSLCSTDLYFNPEDQEGTGSCPNAFGKSWD